MLTRTLQNAFATAVAYAFIIIKILINYDGTNSMLVEQFGVKKA